MAEQQTSSEDCSTSDFTAVVTGSANVTTDSTEDITVYSVHVARKFGEHYIWQIGKRYT